MLGEHSALHHKSEVGYNAYGDRKTALHRLDSTTGLGLFLFEPGDPGMASKFQLEVSPS